MGDIARCAGPHCRRPLSRAATGRRALYCGQNCRQAARRTRVRAEEAAAADAAQLAEARATASRLFRPLKEAGFHTVADLAALVFSAAADSERPRADLDQAIDDMLAEALELALTARRYRDASDLADQLCSDHRLRQSTISALA